ncbi:MAG: DNA2/NAM7 family helicase, partial [Saprospiraceae bacterium]|nr:DNA2/NAM7 family helicase [Saprospiraceae bacterium]
LKDTLDVLGSPVGAPMHAREQAPNFSTYRTNAPSMRVLTLRDLPERHCVVVIEEDEPTRELLLRYNVPDRNEHFMDSIHILRKVFGFPVVLQLIDVTTDEAGALIPGAWVVEPDYLMDVSAISECFKDTGQEPYAYLVRKFLPHETTEPILIGNIANFFLDRLLNEPDTSWQELFLETFQLFPFVYAPMSDAQVKSISGKAQKHFLNIKSLAKGGLIQQDIDPGDCFVEPSFFSNLYGIQGRLDLFFKNEKQSAIIELKSGTPFKPNSYGISRSHFTQTLLYDLLVRSVYGKQTDPVKYIFYSGVDLNQLRFAPTIVPEQMEAIQVRNKLVAIERMLTQIRPGDADAAIFNKLQASKGKGFTERDYGRFEKAYSGLAPLEKKYFNAFVGFIAREHWLAKVGEENNDTLHGNAALWRSSPEEKLANFAILNYLQLLENRADQPDPVVVFKRTPRTSELANFRIGDIAVLYPALSDTDTVLQHQVIRCTISKLDNDRVEVQLRFRQHNLKPFETKGFWCLEPDMLDSGFTAMYRGLLEWAESPPPVRAQVLGLIATPPSAHAFPPANLVEKIVRAPGFFLLWGPPGTGKTSVLLRDLAAWALRETSENILLLAYTNRAVDEICEALESIGGDVATQYVRIGGRHATAERFRGQLLSSKTASAKNREALRNVLENHRIFVSTVASFGHNETLLHLKKFDRLIVDEASQILEPQLVGLLTHFKHVTLIGDHRQLPAVTAQRPENTVVDDAGLNEIGLLDLRDSYFERLYRLCRQNRMDWAYDQLEKQGRMHQQIMDFPGKWFYDGHLKVFNPLVQQAPLELTAPETDFETGKALENSRVVFLPVRSAAGAVPGQKTSMEEAMICVRLVLYFKQLWQHNGRLWLPDKTLGIITPWRAQIAQIQSCLTDAGVSPAEVTVDTVERYQGGARDIILISTCAHTEWQLQSLVNLNSEGVDRKLNVALTRAREHLIMLGNPEILGKDERYRAFMAMYEAAKPA